MARTPRIVSLLVVTALACVLPLSGLPAQAEPTQASPQPAPPAPAPAHRTIAPRTFGTAWQWTGTTFPDRTATADQHVTATVAGITSDDRNGAVVLRDAGSSFLRVQVNKTAITVEDGDGVVATADRPGDANATSGTLDAQLDAATLTVHWNGIPALTFQVAKSDPGTGCGVQVWQDSAAAVTIGGTCDDLSGATSATPTTPSPPATAVPTAPAEPTGNGHDWLSGASGPQAADGSFGTWRGDPVEIAGTWVNDPALYPLQRGGELGAWTKPVDVAVAPPDWQGWQAEADGVHDEFYHRLFANLRTLRAGKGTTYVRPWYEFNGSWMPYHMTNADIPAFKRAWARMAAIARAEFPQVQLVYCASAATGSDVYSAFPGTQYVDVGGIDFYNNYPWVNTQEAFDRKADNGAGAYSLNDLQSFYQGQGLPIAINEWSNQGADRTAAQGGGGESPEFIDSMHAWMAAHAGGGAGGLLYELQFNLWSDQFQLFPAGQTVQPLTAARYAADF